MMVDLSKNGVEVLWEYEAGWLVYEYTGFLKKMYPAKRAWIGHRCHSSVKVGTAERAAFVVTKYPRGGRASGVGFVNAQERGKNCCGWCDIGIPDEVHGVMALYNYGSEGEGHDQS